MSDKIAKVFQETYYPDYPVMYYNKAYQVSGHTLTVYIFRNVKTKRVVAFPIVSNRGEYMLDVSSELSAIYSYDFVARKDVTSQIKDLFESLLLKRKYLISLMNKDKELPSVLNISFLSELILTYKNEEGKLATAKVQDGKLLLSINEEEFNLLSKYLDGTGVTLIHASQEGQEPLEEDILYVE